MTLGQRLRELRDARGVSLRRLGDESGVAWNTIARIERDELDPHWSTVVAILAALGCQVAFKRCRRDDTHSTTL